MKNTVQLKMINTLLFKVRKPKTYKNNLSKYMRSATQSMVTEFLHYYKYRL